MSYRSLISKRVLHHCRAYTPNCPRREYATAVRIHHDRKPTPFGQPLFPSHPHLIQPGEVTPGISADEYERRRKALMERLPADSIVVSVAGQIKYMSGQIFYKFRQASDFWYLTGFEEPGSAVILEKTSCPRGYRMTIYSMGKDAHKEKWEGARTSTDDIVMHFKADDAQSIAQFPSALKNLSSAFSNIYLDIPSSSTLSRRGRTLSHKSMLKYLAPGATSARLEYDSVIDSITSSKLRPLAPEVARLRVIKSESEQRIMRAAADISGNAHAKTMRFTSPGMSEHALASHFEYLCAVDGAQRPAYVPVVASGPNALIIHYTSNNQIVRDGELVLIDAGSEYNGYASDITRTYPANGRFTPPQAALYSAVLQVQKYLITMCSEIAQLSLAQIHQESVEALRKELCKIGFNLTGVAGAGDLERILYPHYVGHSIGIDLHESAHFDRNQPLKAGMVITIEPGIYVPQSPLFPKEFHDIGIRIEDDILVGKDQSTVLSVNAPKEIEDVEGACQGLLGLKPF
ncbi:peptidase M24 [Trametopsis cervina]|nr:peptidase M24 [Trametopsis cervina]